MRAKNSGQITQISHFHSFDFDCRCGWRRHAGKTAENEGDPVKISFEIFRATVKISFERIARRFNGTQRKFTVTSYKTTAIHIWFADFARRVLEAEKT